MTDGGWWLVVGEWLVVGGWRVVDDLCCRLLARPSWQPSMWARIWCLTTARTPRFSASAPSVMPLCTNRLPGATRSFSTLLKNRHVCSHSTVAYAIGSTCPMLTCWAIFAWGTQHNGKNLGTICRQKSSKLPEKNCALADPRVIWPA
jgi:hypothetical protein